MLRRHVLAHAVHVDLDAAQPELSIGTTRSMPLIMQADSAASSSSAGLKASGLPAMSVSSAITASLQCASLACAIRRTETTSNRILGCRGSRTGRSPRQQQDPPAGDAGLQQTLGAGAASQHAPAAVMLPVTGNPLRAHFEQTTLHVGHRVKPWYIRK